MDLCFCFCLKNGGTVLEIPLILQSLLEGIKVNTYGIFQGQRKHGNIWRERSLTWSNFPLQLLPEPEFSQAFSPSYELHSSAGSPSAFLHICQHSTKMNGKNMELNHFEVHREAQQIMALVVGLQMFTLALQGNTWSHVKLEQKERKKNPTWCNNVTLWECVKILTREESLSEL